MSGFAGKRIVLVGAEGMLARMVLELAPPGVEMIGLDLPGFDITDRQQVLSTMASLAPQLIINCAAFTQVDRCESEPELAVAVNGAGPGYLATAARQVGAMLVQVSTDYVFDGRGQTPYREEDAPAPKSVYGQSKLKGEQQIVASGLEEYFIVRTSWLFGPGGGNFVETVLRLAGEREVLTIVHDQIGSPTYTADLAGAIYRLIDLALTNGHRPEVAAPFGLYHFANAGQCSWYEFAREILTRYQALKGGMKAAKVEPIGTADYPLPAPRPAYSVFDTSKFKQTTGATIPAWQDALGRYLAVR